MNRQRRALAFGLACATGGVAAAQERTRPRAGENDTMIKVPPSTALATAHWPREGVVDCTFVVRSSGGQSLGNGINEFDWTLQVESRRGLVSVESFRSDADLPGQPIGVFRYAIDDQKLHEFQDLLAASNLGQLHPAMKSHPGNTERLYTVVWPSHGSVRELINNSDEDTNSRIAPLRKRINSMLAASFGKPERAARAGLQHLRLATGDQFEFSLTQLGAEKICFTDPRWPASTGLLQRAVLMVTEFPPVVAGEPPPFLDWKAVPLVQMSPRPETEALVVLDAGAQWKAPFTAWKRQPGKRYLAYFSWASYAGEPTVQGVYRVRGRADSPRLIIEP
jgi:hypothetical protein